LQASLTLPANARENAEDSEEDAAEYPYLGEAIDDQFLKGAPAIDKPRSAILTFIRLIFVHYLYEETPGPDVIDESESLIGRRGDDVLRQFFCSDAYVCSC
jgi:hypothetical protein